MKPIKDVMDVAIKYAEAYTDPFVEPYAQIERITLDTLDVSNPAVKRVVEKAREWSRRKVKVANSSMVIVGPVGTGKTHIAWAMLWSRYLSVEDTPICYTGKFYVANDIIQGLGEHTMSAFVRSDCPILVLDDVGSEQQMEYIGDAKRQALELQRRYFSVINYCYDRMISVIITANLPLADLGDHIGGRAWSRLQEMAPASFMVSVAGASDWRVKRSGR